MTIPNKVKKIAIKEAMKSQHRFKLGAVIYKKGNILNSGFNHANKTHPKSNVPFRTIHAELSSCLGLTRMQLKDASIYVHRVRRDGKVGLAKPCRYCQALLDEVGITDINYSSYSDNVLTQPLQTKH